jgi:hypothetical protein
MATAYNTLCQFSPPCDDRLLSFVVDEKSLISPGVLEPVVSVNCFGDLHSNVAVIKNLIPGI